MSITTTLYRFKIELSDLDRGVYESLDFRVAQHPSEATPYLITRVMAYALNSQDGLQFHPGGLSDSDDPALAVKDPHGSFKLWVEIGSPSARKMHKAGKASKLVKVYTYKNPDALMKEIRANDIHRSEHLEVYSFDSTFLDRMGKCLERENRWSLLHDQGSLNLSWNDQSEQTEIRRHSIV